MCIFLYFFVDYVLLNFNKDQNSCICLRISTSIKFKLYSSGGCDPVNWLSQTRRNLAIEYLNLNFVTTPKLTPLHSFYAEKVISCVWLIPVSRVCTIPSLFDTDILQHILSDLKFSTRSVLVHISN